VRKLKLGIIGTNWITAKFIEAALATNSYELVAVYSRTIEKAKSFADKFTGDTELFSELEEFFSNKKMDVVYIASPNSLHFEQARAAIEHGKNVIVEKPAFSNPEEMDEIIHLATVKNVFYFEALRGIHEESFSKLKDYLEDKNVYGAHLTMAKYSSRMGNLLDGEEPNIFSLKFSGGALMDLGVYVVYPLVALFGMPDNAKYHPQLLTTGADGHGVGTLFYEDFEASFFVGKDVTSFNESEIFLEDGTVRIDSISEVQKIDVVNHQGAVVSTLDFSFHENSMIDEAKDFYQVMMHPTNPKLGDKYQEWTELSRSVSQVMYWMREDAGIVFAADNKE
jgi:predicted dehydrogenase